jgi:hypothetical protein
MQSRQGIVKVFSACYDVTVEVPAESHVFSCATPVALGSGGIDSFVAATINTENVKSGEIRKCRNSGL